jgi:hypothetical protein
MSDSEPYCGRGTNRPGLRATAADARRAGGECPYCGIHARTIQGLAVHMAKAHDIQGPKRAK